MPKTFLYLFFLLSLLQVNSFKLRHFSGPALYGPRPGAVVSTTEKGEVVTDSSIYLREVGA